uniref:alpha/beta fold hydrolase n=1 Tax=Nocardiopsis lucentensis TaxID=53441 RepID=UPI0003728213
VWAPCEEPILAGLECADVQAPLDYANPDGERVTIAISRERAADPERRRGILLTNPGGPGGTGRTLPLADDPERGIYYGLGDERVAEVYDVIGMDPRGSGASTPRMECEVSQTAIVPRPDDADFSRITREAIAAERACQQADGATRPYMTTANTARDMDVIRAALGEERLNYFGVSYGTYLGAVYGSLFPDRLDRSVLDSSVHPDGIWRDVFTRMAPAYTANVERYTPWIAERDDVYGMGSTPEEVVATFEETSRRLRENPRDDVPGLPPGETFGTADFDFAVGYYARFQSEWDVSASVLWYLVHDEPFPPSAGAAAAEEPEYESFNAGLLIAVQCEAEWPDRISGYYRDMREVREEHPFGLGAYQHQPQPCTFASYDPVEPLVDLERDGHPAGLVIAGEFDANTAYDGGPAMAERLDNPLITVADDGGHGFYSMPGMSCVTDAVDAYLVDGAAPEEATCPGLPRPSDALRNPAETAGVGEALAGVRQAMTDAYALSAVRR